MTVHSGQTGRRPLPSFCVSVYVGAAETRRERNGVGHVRGVVVVHHRKRLQGEVGGGGSEAGSCEDIPFGGKCRKRGEVVNSGTGLWMYAG